MPNPERLDLAERRLLERGADVQRDAPWNPLPELKVGDRVQIRLNGECTECDGYGNKDYSGMLGTVDEWYALLVPCNGHPYAVFFDHTPALCAEDDCNGQTWNHGSFFARSELQRIQEAPLTTDPTIGAQQETLRRVTT